LFNRFSKCADYLLWRELLSGGNAQLRPVISQFSIA
jgi:hypothetical protein